MKSGWRTNRSDDHCIDVSSGKKCKLLCVIRNTNRKYVEVHVEMKKRLRKYMLMDDNSCVVPYLRPSSPVHLA